MKTIRVILNGKGAANPDVRTAIYRIRDEGQPMEVRCTWEGGDAARFAREAVADGIDVPSANGVHFTNVASGGFWHTMPARKGPSSSSPSATRARPAGASR